MPLQTAILRAWAVHGANAELVVLDWHDGVWTSKLERLLLRIDMALADDEQVGLVGLSAGGSAVINAFARRRGVISGVVCVASKLRGPHDVLPAHRDRSPAFAESVQMCERSLCSLDACDRRRIASLYSLRDEVVPRRDTAVAGALNTRAVGLGHNAVIAWQLVAGSRWIVRFLGSGDQRDPHTTGS